MFTVDQILDRHFPNLPLRPLATPLLRRLLKEKAFQDFAETYPDLSGISFVESVLEYFDFGYRIDPREQERIPAQGRVVIIANHPIGSLDGLALIKMVSDVRSDFKVVANAVLSELEPLAPLLCPVNVFSNTAKGQYQGIKSQLDSDAAVILFPAGEVSRLRPQGVRDTKWRNGFLRLAKECRAPILPVRIVARCSSKFYLTSMLYKPLATALLVQEMFGQQHKKAQMHVGELIPHSSFTGLKLPIQHQVKLFKKHLYRLGTKKHGLFATEAPIASPQPRKALLKALSKTEKLGTTPDGMGIHLYRYQDDCPLMKEIGRAREVAFRAVGEGTGKRRDLDKYDPDYLHLVLWDPNQLELVGAYRLGDSKALMEKKGIDGLYSSTLFDYSAEMQPYLKQGLELGRSFVQPSYWGKRALDYLWLGIGAFLTKNPQYRYMFGPVSISAQLPPAAKDLMVTFYRKHFSPVSPVASHGRPYQVALTQEQLDTLFVGDYKSDFAKLRAMMDDMGSAVPTLYKQYSELCEPGGVTFHDFGIDPDFGDCIDGLVMADITKLKPSRRKRYMDVHREKEEA